MRKAEWIVGIRCDVENVSWRFKVQIKDQNELLTLFWYSWMEWYMEMSTCHCTGVKSIKQWSVLNKTAEGMEHRPANVQLTAIISRGLRPVKIRPVNLYSLVFLRTCAYQRQTRYSVMRKIIDIPYRNGMRSKCECKMYYWQNWW